MECGVSTTTRRSAHHSAFRLVCNARSRGHGDPRLSQKVKPRSSTPNAGGGRNLGAAKQHCGVGSTAYFDDCSTLITSLQIYGAPRGISIYCTSTAHRCHCLTALCDDHLCCYVLSNSTTLCLSSFLICFHRRPCLVEHVVFSACKITKCTLANTFPLFIKRQALLQQPKFAP